MYKKCCIVVVKRQAEHIHGAEHGGQKHPKYIVGEPISSYGIEWCSLSQNPYVDDIAFSKQTICSAAPSLPEIGKRSTT